MSGPVSPKSRQITSENIQKEQRENVKVIYQRVLTIKPLVDKDLEGFYKTTYLQACLFMIS